MSLKLIFEIGHSAVRKTKPSKEGFTHDWELFVRGGSDGDIGHFVEKVIFNLHESFPKPKRVIKEPPYTVKEAGYAGFVLTIDIYLKNRDEPKKVTFEYDLDLQPMKTQVNELVIPSPSEEFRRKCLKGGGILISNSSNDLKNREQYNNKNAATMLSVNEIKKSSKRPEETKPINKVFTDLFGAPLKKPDSRSIPSPNPTKLQSSSSSKVVEKNLPSSVTGAGKDRNEKTKHKHSPNKDGKEKKSSDVVKSESEKSKKDKPKDRERSDKKDKTSKRPSSPSPSSSSSARNSTNLIALPQSKNDSIKPQPKQSLTPVPVVDPSFSKKSTKKEKKSHDKERDRNEKKDARSMKESLSTKEKPHYDLPASKGSSMKDRESAGKDDRDKVKSKPSQDLKTTPPEFSKKQHDKDSERKHKHKKKEKAKEKEVGKDQKKEKSVKSTPIVPTLAKSKEPVTKHELQFKSNLSVKDSSDSEVDSPPSIKQDSDNSMPDFAHQKIVIDKSIKKPRERTKPATDKEDKGRKRKSSRKDDRDSSASPPPPSKLARKDLSKSPSVHERPSESNSHHFNSNNNNVDGSSKISNDYMNELKELKLKITTMKNNEELQQVVRLIASTGCYEITKSSFDFDLVQLDRSTVQRLQEFFAPS